MNICQRVKREFGSELQVIREKTNGSRKEHGFAICLLPSELIITTEGFRPIKTLQAGDLVMTHKGRFRHVLAVSERQYCGSILSIRSAGSYVPTEVTPQHPFLVSIKIRSGDSFLLQEKWLEADQLLMGQRIMTVLPRLSEETDISFVQVNAPKAKFSRAKSFNISVDEHLMRFVGYYLAEGAVLQANRASLGPDAIRFTFGKDLREFSFASELSYSLKKVGLAPCLWLKRDGWKVEAYSRAFATWMAAEFGNGAGQKRIPFWCLKLPSWKIEFLLEAYINGDGHRFSGGFQSATVSRELALALKLLGEKLGFSSGVYLIGHGGSGRIQGRNVRLQPAFANTFRKAAFRGNRMQLAPSRAFFRKAIRNISKRQYTGPVFNLHVDEDNSFCTVNHAVHNCLNGGEAEASRIVEGNNQSVLIPGCAGESAALIHSHPHSPEMERRLGPMVRQYTGHPSALDLLPHPSIPHGCILSDDFLVCHGKSKGSMKAIKKLMVKEKQSNEAFHSWMLGGVSDRAFRKTMRKTINTQKTAMKSTGSYCSTKI